MLVPLSWLAEFVDALPAPEVLAERLTMAGLEVEAVARPAHGFGDSLVVALIREVEKHPNADRLSLCQVDDGAEVRPVVCGARNMKAGDRVVLAKPGARLPGGIEIKVAKLRGVRSEGMLCSSTELGLPAAEDGIMILPPEAALGEAAAALLGLDETVFELSVTPNRGDCLSIVGLAREVAAVCKLQVKPAFDRKPTYAPGPGRVTVSIEDEAACFGYRGIEIAGVNIGPSPLWLRTRLSACGMRAINNVVDVTNLVLLELGQPLHAFDAALLVGDAISVRTVACEESFVSLDDQSLELEAGDIVICDGEGPVALGGVMGGARTATGDGSTRIFLEAAVFAPQLIRRTSRRLGLITESSYRFERGIDASGLDRAISRAAQLIIDLAGGRVEGGIVGVAAPRTSEAIMLRRSRLEQVLGVPVGAEETIEILSRLGVEKAGRADADGEAPADGCCSFIAPAHRHDLTREIDLIEEVARVRGYDLIPAEMPTVTMAETERPDQDRLARRLRLLLATEGLSECIGFTFCTAKMNELFPGLHDGAAAAVGLRNPLRSDQSQLRKSLLPTLLDAYVNNSRNGVEPVDVFTLGRSFCGGDPPREIDGAAGLLWGPRRSRGPGAAGPATFWDAKGVVERMVASENPGGERSWRPCASRPEYHPRACAEVLVQGELVGHVGMIHPFVAESLEISEEIALFEVDTRKLLQYAPRQRSLRSIPRYPPSKRDVSLLVPRDMLAGEIVTAIENLGERLIERVSVFDEYTGKGVGEGQKALAFSVVYRSSERTLTDDEVGALHGRVIDHLVEQLRVKVRV